MKSQALVTLAACSAILLGGATPNLAYSKFEHEQLTYYAFELARGMVCDGEDAPPSCVALADSQFGQAARGCKDDRSWALEPSISALEIGRITRGVDYFTHPTRLAPEAEACRTKVQPNCRESVFENPGCSNFTKAGCLDAAFSDTRCRIGRRQKNRLFRAVATHRNDSHFREGARDHYNEMHSRALRLAHEWTEEGEPGGKEFGVALIAEAVAIHFLQDGFAPGHLAAPRSQYGDSYAGSVHDRHNAKGLEFWASGRLCESAKALRKALKSNEEIAYLNPRLKKTKLIPRSELLEDFELFERECGAPGVTYEGYGDKELLPSKMPLNARLDRSQALHRVSLLILAAQSIEEVLRGTESECRLQLCFNWPSAGPPAEPGPVGSNCAVREDDQYVRVAAYSEPSSTVSEAISGSADGSTQVPTPDREFWAPALAIGQAPVDLGFPEDRTCWQRDNADLLYGYRTEPGEAPDSILKGSHYVNGLHFGYSSWGDTRKRLEFAQDFRASERVVKRSADGRLGTPESARPSYGALGYSLHYEGRGSGEAYGVGLLYTYGLKQLPTKRDLDVYVALEPGIGYYKHPGGTSTRFRGSGRVGIGFSLLAVEAMAERGPRFEEAVSAEKVWRYSMNLKLRVSATWLSRLPGLKSVFHRSGS